MKPKNLILRRRLAYVESQLQADAESSRHSPRLKEERLRRLTEEKIAIQKSLDSIVYPILTLPVELTGEIFVHCLPDTPAPPRSTIAPMLLARICRQRRNIACSTPKLWAALRIARFKGPGLPLLVRLWFHRAGGAPKSLSLQLPSDRCPNSFFRTTDHCCACPSDLLLAEHWANLSSFHSSTFTPIECFALLSRAPQLAHCVFDDVLDGPLPSTPPSRHVLANLQHLSLHPSSFAIDSLQFLLNSITCPVLRSFEISISSPGFTHSLFLPFLERAPHIETFAIEVWSVSPGTLTTILDALPILTSLRVYAPELHTFDILRALSESPTFLPRVKKVAVESWRTLWTDLNVETLVNAVTSRWEAKSTAQLLDFEFVCYNPPLDPRILACVSLVEEKGMRLRFGRE
ncbi:hypothetical protein C8R46DRAFT_348009 [Mycena filopes]|nr:hypothetical protein C8R46DRAFT_348009 [Mycena filopes]